MSSASVFVRCVPGASGVSHQVSSSSAIGCDKPLTKIRSAERQNRAHPRTLPSRAPTRKVTLGRTDRTRTVTRPSTHMTPHTHGDTLAYVDLNFCGMSPRNAPRAHVHTHAHLFFFQHNFSNFLCAQSAEDKQKRHFGQLGTIRHSTFWKTKSPKNSQEVLFESYGN